MLPLLPLALELLPSIGRWIAGDTGGKVAGAAAAAIQTLTGTESPDAARAALAADPALAAQVRIRLAEIEAEQDRDRRAAELESLKAHFADVAGARGQTVALAQAGSRVQWAPVLVSILVLATFGIVMWCALTRSLPAGSETILNMLLGTLAAMATSVVGYWVGSSAGSAQKTDLLYRSTPQESGR